MDLDFTFLLTWAVIITGSVWALDRLLFRSRRLQRAANQNGQAPASTGESAPGNRRTPGADPRLVEFARTYFPWLLLVLALRSFLAEPYKIPSESMLPTLEVGDFILVNKFAYGLRLPVLGSKILPLGEPQRGDIMVFVPPHDPRYFIKRVIGLPGDHIVYRNKNLFINGERASYELLSEDADQRQPDRAPAREYRERIGDLAHTTRRYPVPNRDGEWIVPEGAFFVMGDNRDKSDDSRRWRFVSEDKVVGKCVAIWVHKKPGLHWPTFERNQWIGES